MARKRKIPARKHHGVRDPLKQLEDRERKLQNVVNSPPVLGNDQKVSFKFEQFKKLADDAKAGKKVKRMHRGHEDKPKGDATKAATTGNKLKNIKQFVDETDRDYLRRVNRMTSESLREAQYETKYGVTVVRDAKTGAITIKKRPKNELDELLKLKMKEKRSSGKVGRRAKKVTQPAKPMDPKIAKQLIKQAIKEDEEEKRKAATGLQEFTRDEVKFGEIVHGPPTLSTLPRKATKSETVPRPGKKDNLLLRSMMSETVTAKPSSSTAKSKYKPLIVTVSKAQLRGKRKDLPVATRSMLEAERSKIVELYRNLKKSKEKTSS